MNNATKILIAMIMVAGLCIGCGKSKTPEPVKPDAVAKPAAKPEATDAKWEPETAKEKPAAHNPNDGGDHSGHNH